jgi:hypothetical protein
LTDGFLQIIQRRGFVSVNTRFQIPPKEKNHTLKNRESEGATARLRNGKWGARRTQTRGAQLTKSPLLLKWPTQRKRMPTTSSTPLAYLLSITKSKDVRFPLFTLYIYFFLVALWPNAGTGRLYPTVYPWYTFLLQVESTPVP